jgi:cytochrome b
VHNVRVWDLPTRAFHWSLAILVGFSGYTGYYGGLAVRVPRGVPGAGHLITNLRLHEWSGLGILILVLFRVCWGFFGSATARFANFVRGPRAVIHAIYRLRPGDQTHYSPGHNALGALMVVALLSLLLLQVTTGMFLQSDDDIVPFQAPFNHLVSSRVADSLGALHSKSFWLLSTLVSVHIIAVMYHWRVKRQNLIAAMITGRRSALSAEALPEIQFVSTLRALLALVLTTGIVWTLVVISG